MDDLTPNQSGLWMKILMIVHRTKFLMSRVVTEWVEIIGISCSFEDMKTFMPKECGRRNVFELSKICPLTSTTIPWYPYKWGWNLQSPILRWVILVFVMIISRLTVWKEGQTVSGYPCYFELMIISLGNADMLSLGWPGLFLCSSPILLFFLEVSVTSTT